MSQLSDYTVREYRPGDEEAVLSAFNRVFAAVDPSFRARSLDVWRWQFLLNPSGWRMYLCFAADGQCVSQYAGVPIPMELEGHGDAHFVQAVDSFSDPAHARGLRRPGIFVVTGYPFAANYGGEPPARTPIMYGLPVRPAWRIGQRFLEYELARTQNKLTREPEAVLARGAQGVDVEEVSAFPDAMAGLSRELAGAFAASTRRSVEHMTWRYLRHPERRYRIALARRAGALQGCAVFRAGDFDGQEREGLVCDWAVPPGRPAVSAALRGWCAELARASGCAKLTLILPDSAPDWLDFQRAGLRVAPTRYFVTARQYVEPYTMAWLRRHWYYTLGDTDLC